MKKKLLFIFMMVIMLGATATGVQAKNATDEFRIAVATFDAEILDPVGGTVHCKYYQTLLFDSLVGIEPPSNELSTKTGIAYKWNASPDYKQWTFYLRKDIKFHNGEKLTANDVKYSIERALGPTSLSSNKATLARSIERAEVVDDYTVIVHCKVPDSMVPLYLSEQMGPDAMIVPQHYIEVNGDEYFRLHPIGTGPFKLKEYVPGSSMLFESIGKHWAFGNSKYKYVRLSLVPEAMARIGLLKRGEADLIPVPIERVKEVKQLGFPIVEKSAVNTHMFYTHDTWDKRYPVSDIRVREALNIAIDRKAILKMLYSDIGELARYDLASAVAIGYERNDQPYPYNPEKAKALLAAAGYGPTNPCKIPVYSYTMVDWPECEKVIEICTSYWAKVGFDIEIIKVPDYGVLKKKWMDRNTYGAISPNSIGGRIWPLSIIFATVGSAGVFSTAQIPELDKKIEAAMAGLDPKKRATLAHEVYRMISDNYIGIPVIEATEPFGVNPKAIPDYQNWKMGVTMYDYNLEWVLFPRQKEGKLSK